MPDEPAPHAPAPAPGPDVQAVQVARLYYIQGLTTDAIAGELGLSRPKVSRLLSHARRSGLVEIRIHDPEGQAGTLEAQLQARYPFLKAQVVSVPQGSPEDLWQERVAAAAASLLGSLIRPGMTVGLAWGNTVSAVSHALTPRPVPGVTFVQLNGSANAADFMSGFVTDTVLRFARSFSAGAQLFPVPTFFDDPSTKQAMWRERSVRHVLGLQTQADLLLYSIGSHTASTPSHVYAAGYLGAADLDVLAAEGAVGDIATVFYRADGSFDGLSLNARASGPDLSLVRDAPDSICVVSGLGKVAALHAALRGGLMRRLIVDEITAQAVLDADS
ncbi:DNA-binding transcriptional regulator LsrR (DeoR family) [Deinococcus metalli]|uniref:Transcriptional regulator n=1 Tax=Deinococcus metalli TaxID=1141878 RepID=A0A7W8NPK3_9DEIO|nr:sugar-binding transcriptional regulator [Deinococcus metalli]MBB5375875.1 DNA-binding transcriptional regulator LsrR (DeoR family) [Deinococcus metalli]GHF36382.1 transcriptional regulator [Deinococcus metalli]